MAHIEGLTYICELIAEVQHDWRRSIQHFSYKYDYRDRTCTYLGESPNWLQQVAKTI